MAVKRFPSSPCVSMNSERSSLMMYNNINCKLFCVLLLFCFCFNEYMAKLKRIYNCDLSIHYLR